MADHSASSSECYQISEVTKMTFFGILTNMKIIPLTKGKQVVVDDVDFETLNKYKWCFASGYAVRKVNNKRVFMHRFLMGVKDRKQFVDHKNCDPLDNRRENLRLCTPAQNSMNRKKSKNNTSGYNGVVWYKQYNKWRVQLKYKRKQMAFGCYDDIKDAAKRYNEVAIKLFGEFAQLNLV